MKNINLTLILIIISLQIIFAQSSQENKIDGKRTEAEYRKLGLLDNTDNFSFTKSLDTTILMYKSFTVKKRIIETSEEILIYRSNKRIYLRDNLSYYFLGIVNDRFAIFDEGTSNTRGLMIFDLHEEKELINIVYISDLVLENNTILFKSEVKINDEKLKPNCPPDIEVLSNKIYLEEQYFDFQKLEIIYTGKYICSFME
ncbi:MAG: hypothetical protein GQ564_12300 [Bacteroidales bacterium]|nr:hypothetical protein [Bacteroidales bacterium]